MNTQTFAQAQDFTAITDEELTAVNGGGFFATAGYVLGQVPTLGLLGVVDMATGGNVAMAAFDAWLSIQSLTRN